jgi:hypothetical protein
MAIIESYEDVRKIRGKTYLELIGIFSDTN